MFEVSLECPEFGSTRFPVGTAKLPCRVPILSLNALRALFVRKAGT